MPRPRTPTEVLDLKGSFIKNPQRRRPVGPKSYRPLGGPPDELSERETAVWHEFVGNAPDNVLTSNDRMQVEIVARLMAKFRGDWLTGAELASLRNALTELGATPASRSKITAVGEQEQSESPWDGLQVVNGGKA